MTNTTQHILTTGEITTYVHVQAKATKRGQGEVRKGHNVSIVPGKWVRVWGQGERYVMNPETGRRETKVVKYDTTFRIGDCAVYGGFNMTYTGTVTAIGKTTVTVKDAWTTKRMDLHRFSAWNEFFDLDAINKRNSEWLD